ncbi:MAG: hypothetical protein R2788_19185 [Saprospiraceae bacterium]
MAVSRITDVLDLESTGRFVIVFGNFVQEVFIADDLELCSKEQILHKYLKKEGFQRILFFDSRNRIHCYDETSLRLSSKNADISSKEQRNPATGNEPSSGQNGRPLGGRRRSILSSPNKSNQSRQSRSSNAKLTSRGFYQVPCSSNNALVGDELDAYLRSDNIKTALLIKFTELGMDATSYSRFLNIING